MSSLRFLILVYLSKVNTCNIKNCIQCSSSSPDICVQCSYKYTLSRSGCLFSEIQKIQGIANCKNISETRTCTKCNEGYHIVNGFCEANCRSDCVCFFPFECESKRYSNKRILCKSGYYHDGKKDSYSCKSCPTHCQDCEDNCGCVKCDSGYELKGKCSDSCKMSKSTIVIISTSIIIPFTLCFCVGCFCNHKRKKKLKKESEADSPNYLATIRRNPEMDSQVNDNLNQNEFDSQLSRNIEIIYRPTSEIPAIHILNKKNQECKKVYSKSNICARKLNETPSFCIDSNDSFVDGPPAVNPFKISTICINSDEKVVSDDESKIKIRKRNFFEFVKIVSLDKRRKYGDQYKCFFCSKGFKHKTEVRVLPCNHAFHGKCIFHAIIIQKERFCPICNTEY